MNSQVDSLNWAHAFENDFTFDKDPIEDPFLRGSVLHEGCYKTVEVDALTRSGVDDVEVISLTHKADRGLSEEQGPVRQRDRPILVCLYCRAQKRKCDRVQPVCGSCIKIGKPECCTWDPRLLEQQSQGRRRRRRRRRQESSSSKRSAESSSKRSEEDMEKFWSDFVAGGCPSDSVRAQSEAFDESFSHIMEPAEDSGCAGTEGEHCAQLEDSCASVKNYLESVGPLRLDDTEIKAVLTNTALKVSSWNFIQNRTCFDVAFSRYCEISDTFGLEPISAGALFGLYDLWKELGSLEKLEEYQPLTSTLEERQALCNTFCAVAAFAFACTFSTVDLHLCNILGPLSDILHEALAVHKDIYLPEVAQATQVYFRSLTAVGLVMIRPPCLRRAVASAHLYEKHLESLSHHDYPDIILARQVALLGQGRMVDMLDVSIRDREAALANGNIPSIHHLKGIINATVLYSANFFVAIGARSPHDQVHDFRTVSYSSLDANMKNLWDRNVVVMKELYFRSITMSKPSDPHSDNSQKRSVSFLVLWLGFAMYWDGNFSIPGVYMAGMQDWLSKQLQGALLFLLCDGNERMPLSTPSYASLFAGIAGLAMLDPQGLVNIVDASRILHVDMTRMGQRPKNMMAEIKKYYDNSLTELVPELSLIV